MCATPSSLPGRGLQRRPADVHEGRQRRRQVLAADVGECLGDGGVRRQDHRLRRHHAAGGLLAVDHQPPDLLGVLGLHQLEQLAGGLGRQVGDQVGGVVGGHLLEDVGGALGVEVLEDLDLVLLGQLLEDVGQPLVVEGGDDLAAALRGELVDHVGGVGRAQVGQRGDQVLGALVVLALLEPLDVVPLHDVGLRPAAEALRALGQRDPGEHPVAGAGLLHGDVEDDALDAAAAHLHLAVEHLPDHEGLGRPLLEAAHVQQAGGDHLAGVDVGHPRHRGEDLAAAEHLDDQPHHPRLAYVGPQHHHDVAHLAHRVALGIEHRQPGQPGREDAGRCGAHAGT